MIINKVVIPLIIKLKVITQTVKNFILVNLVII